MKVGDWSHEVYTIAHNGMFVFESQLNPINLHVYGYLSVTPT